MEQSEQPGFHPPRKPNRKPRDNNVAFVLSIAGVVLILLPAARGLN